MSLEVEKVGHPADRQTDRQERRQTKAHKTAARLRREWHGGEGSVSGLAEGYGLWAPKRRGLGSSSSCSGLSIVPAWMSIYLSNYPSVYLSIYLTNLPRVATTSSVPGDLSNYLSICLPIYQSV